MQAVKELHQVKTFNKEPTSLEQKLFKIFTSKPDEPLYCDNLSVAIDNTSQKIGIDDENRRPQYTTIIRNNHNDEQNITPPKNANANFMKNVQRDLNSPSAGARMRALQALRIPANNFYNFDVSPDEADIITTEERQSKPKSIQDVMKDVVIYVEIRDAEDNRSAGVKQVISDLGAIVNDRLLKNTTHVVFKDGLLSTYNKAKSWNIPIVSLLWIEACKRHLVLVNPKEYGIANIHRYENPELYDKIKRHKSRQPGTEETCKSAKSFTPLKSAQKSAESPRTATPKTKINIPPSHLRIASTSRNNNITNNEILSMDESAIAKATNNIVTGSQTKRNPNRKGACHQSAKSNEFVKETDVSQTKSTRRCTVYESQEVEETVFGNFTSTPANRRQTINLSNKLHADLRFKTPQMHTVQKHSFIQKDFSTSTPQGKGIVNKTLLCEYNSTFSTNKTAKPKSRLTLFDISMDIIKQRVENINKITRINNSLNNQIDSDNDEPLNYADRLNKKTAPHPNLSIIANDALSSPTVRPLKRKLFTPPTFNLSRTNGLMDDKATPKKSAIDLDSTKKPRNIKKALYGIIGERSTSKRQRDDDVMLQSNQTKMRKTVINSVTEMKTKTIAAEPKYSATNLRRSTRRSTMHFRIIEKVPEPNLPRKNRRLSEQVMVFTNMHQAQIDNIEKAVQSLGHFRIDDKVSSKTSHLVTLDSRRTMNLMRGLIRGIWILDYNWIVESVNNQEWQLEELYEMKSFSKGVTICRMERQLFGRNYKMNIFTDIGSIYLPINRKYNELKEIIRLAGGVLTKNIDEAAYIIGECATTTTKLNLLPNWIIDCITNAQIVSTKSYLIRK